MSAYIKWTLIMAKGKAPRQRYEDDFKRRVVAEANASDVSVSAIARRHGLNANLVFNWRKTFSGEAPGGTLPEARLLPIEIKIEEPAERIEAPQPSPPVLEIVLPCGSHLRCGAGIDPVLLGHALVALRPGASDRAA